MGRPVKEETMCGRLVEDFVREGPGEGDWEGDSLLRLLLLKDEGWNEGSGLCARGLKL